MWRMDMFRIFRIDGRGRNRQLVETDAISTAIPHPMGDVEPSDYREAGREVRFSPSAVLRGSDASADDKCSCGQKNY